jgi:hypothetical protein
MLKTVTAAAAILAIAGTSFVYAQQQYRGPGYFGPGGPRAERHRPTAADMSAFTDARIAALKAGLELTPDQAKNWPAFEQALRDMAQLRIERIKARQEGAQKPAGSPFDRMSGRADRLAKASTALKHVADAGAPLYATLDDAQKGRFTRLARMLRPHQGGWHNGPGGNQFGGRRFGETDQNEGPQHGMLGRTSTEDSRL